ncbi:hypothetical protein [Micromonospora sp. WMMB482]|uniref:hypothetical protein n=1 Tax=Micromonospora sp. WMMB482 TaxID=2849653 RepID=UPI0027E0DB1F|nr:hypothetical protein [Micromonospora sp. WMMB482]
MFLPDDDAAEARARQVVDKYALVEGADVLGWREVPTDPSGLGETALAAMPRVRQLFVAAHRLTGSPDGPAGSPLTGLDWTGWRSACASRSSGRPPSGACRRTSRRCRAARWCGRACSPRTSSRRSTRS